jgi:large subunit ribosomal protein L22
MASRSTAKYLRVPPRKARLVADLLRGKGANEASAILRYQPQKTAKMISKVLKTAVSNATSAGRVDPDNLYVKTIAVDPGPIIKRFTSRAMGRGTRVNRRTSHITVVLAER